MADSGFIGGALWGGSYKEDFGVGKGKSKKGGKKGKASQKAWETRRQK